MTGAKHPERLILEYLETHDVIGAEEAQRLRDYGSLPSARSLLQSLAQQGLLERNYNVRRGPQRFTKGRHFAEWREWEASGFQSRALTHDQFEAPGLLRLLMLGPR